MRTSNRLPWFCQSLVPEARMPIHPTRRRILGGASLLALPAIIGVPMFSRGAAAATALTAA
jgi:hypothetical protein